MRTFRFTLTLLLAPMSPALCARAAAPAPPPSLGSFPCAAQDADAGRANLTTPEQATA